MKVLITGASGFLGWTCAHAFSRSGIEVIGTSRDGSGMPRGVHGVALDLGDGGRKSADLISALKPDAVLHCAAMADPDACARDAWHAHLVNAVATGTLVRAAGAARAYCIYVSSDLVFGGDSPPYAESDAPNPLGPYMTSKAAGEQQATAASRNLLVARLALLYGRSGGRRQSFTEFLVDRLRAGEPVPLFSDQFRTPLEVTDAAGILQDLLRLQPVGLLHVGGPDRVSRLEHGLAVARSFGLDTNLCRPARVADLPHLAPRPRDVSLRIDRLVALLGRTPLGIREGCARMAHGPENAAEAAPPSESQPPLTENRPDQSVTT